MAYLARGESSSLPMHEESTNLLFPGFCYHENPKQYTATGKKPPWQLSSLHMLKTLWQSLTSSESDSQDKAAVFDRAQVKLLNELFPIGKKLRYYPESHRRIFLRTIVLAYCINNQTLYSHEAIRFGDDGFPKGFEGADGKLVPFAKWETFQLLLPDTTEMEKNLDYFTRADLGRGGQFGKGNIIMLVGDVIDKCVPMLETTVFRHQVMHDGPYADTPTILVTPDLDTLVLADRRKKQRVHCALPASLHYANETAVLPCTLRDFSEVTLCLGVDDAASSMPPLDSKHPVIAEFGFPGETTTYKIRGKVFHSGDHYCVIEIEQLYRDGKFYKVNLMDIVEIKTGLLNLQQS